MNLLAIGLMSGTSLDGVDGVLADFGAGPAPAVQAHAYRPFPAKLAALLFELQSPGADEIARSQMAAQSLVRVYAEVVAALLQAAGVAPGQVAVIGAHGQTVRHRPEAGYTVQLNAPALLAELTGIDVIADFRSADVAAGGQGAPLVPALHAALFRDPTRHRAIVNLGGIANITDLPPRAASDPVRGWDCGPANVLLDHWATRHGRGPYDAGGAWAAAGQVDPPLLAALLDEPWLQLRAPKSTGRDLFHGDWLDRRLEAADCSARRVAPEDIQATLLAFTVAALADSLDREAPAVAEVFVCGGGTRNGELMRCLAGRLGQPLAPTDRLGMPAHHVEALAFAWLAVAHLERRAGNLPDVTGARGPRVLGGLYPAGLDPARAKR